MGQEESRFFGKPTDLRTGSPGDAVQGLEARMCVHSDVAREKYFSRLGKGLDGIKDEVKELAELVSSGELEKVPSQEGMEILEILDYVCNQKTGTLKKEYPNGTLDKDRDGLLPSHFASHRNAQEAHLEEAEVIAARLYTTFLFKYMNWPLRDEQRFHQGLPCPLPVTTYHAEKAIKKLRSLHVDEKKEVVLWRGMQSSQVTKEFMEQGGTELAFMSTTRDLGVAVRYSLSKHSLLFKIVAADFMATGADVQWLSAFPGEAEVLYPPLTYLKPTGRTDFIKVARDDGHFEICFEVVELKPTMG